MSRFLPWRIAAPLVVGVAVSVTILSLSEVAYTRLDNAHLRMSGALQAQTLITELFAAAVDAETSLRGYLLTRRDDYLEPYKRAFPRIDEARLRLQELLAQYGDAKVRTLNDRLFQLIAKRLAELEAMLKLDLEAGRTAALELLRTNIGKEAMDEVRLATEALSLELTTRLVEGRAQWYGDLDKARAGMRMMSSVAVVLLVAVMVLAWRELRQRESREVAALDEQRRLEVLVDERTAELSELSNHLQSLREEEKSKLARELHDELGGILVAAKMDVAWVREQLATHEHESAKRLERAMSLLDEGAAVKRRIIEELRPTLLDDLGLAAALEWLAADVCRRAGLAYELATPGGDELPPRISLAVFRIVQEALTNTVKHAQAKSIAIEIVRNERELTLLVSDDGIGIDPPALHSALSHGILGMRQRVRALAGEFALRSRPGRGTTVEVRLPLAAGTPREAGPPSAPPPT